MKTDDDLTRDLARAFRAAPGHLSRLHGRLATAAQAEGVLDVAYRTVDSPVGPLLLAATDLGLVRVAYVSEDGRPRAVRAVGTACATNPLPVVVPCHRVVRSDGRIGGYLGGVGAKRTLLTLEAGA